MEAFPRVINGKKAVSLANLAIFQVESTKLKTSFQSQGIAEKGIAEEFSYCLMLLSIRHFSLQTPSSTMCYSMLYA